MLKHDRCHCNAQAFGQRLFDHGLVDGLEAPAKMGLQLTVHLVGQEITHDAHEPRVSGLEAFRGKQAQPVAYAADLLTFSGLVRGCRTPLISTLRGFSF